MSGKVIDARAGDRWTRDNDGDLWLYRENENKCTMFNKWGAFPSGSSYRFPDETDLPTPEAHAQLREWGYEVRGDEFAGHHSIDDSGRADKCFAACELGAIASVKAANPGDPQHITESRVVEIVEEVLAAQANPAPAPDDWRARCRVFQGKNGNRNWGVFSPSGKWYCSNVTDKWLSFFPDPDDDYSRFTDESAARAALAKAPPPPDVSPEPDWRGLLAELVADIDHIALGSVDSNDTAWHKENWDKLFASHALAAARKELK